MDFRAPICRLISADSVSSSSGPVCVLPPNSVAMNEYFKGRPLWYGCYLPIKLATGGSGLCTSRTV